MNLNTKIIYAALLILFSTAKSNSQMVIKQSFDDFIFIKNIPNSNEIVSEDLSISPILFNSSIKLNKVTFLKALDNRPKALKNSDETLFTWNYSPWADIVFLTSKGKYEIQLFLGGLGFVTLPDGTKGAVLFDFTNNKKP